MSITRRLWRCLFVVSIGMSATTAAATVVLPQNLEHLERRAQLVFVGVCTSHTTAIHARGFPVNVFTFEVIEPVKGGLRRGSQVRVRQIGSNVPNARGLVARIPGLPTYAVGQEVLLFLHAPSRIGLTSPIGLSQGLFRVVRDRANVRRIVIGRARRTMLLRGVDAARYEANERFTETERRLLRRLPERVDLTEFCSLVRKIAEERTRAAGDARR